MANGDAAAAAGLAVFASTQDIRQGYDNDNIRGDELAQHLTAGTHPASAIVSGTLSTARIPNLNADKITAGTLDSDRIPNLNASKITAGTLTRPISTSSACTITGQLNVQRIQATNASYGIDGVTGSPYFSGLLYAVATYNTAVPGIYRSVWVSSNGQFGHTASTRKLKQNIVDATLTADAAKQLKLREFRYKTDVKENGDNAHVHVGLIAEELLEIPGMEKFVFFDKDGNPEGIHYELLALALIPLIQDNEARLTALEERLK